MYKPRTLDLLCLSFIHWNFYSKVESYFRPQIGTIISGCILAIYFRNTHDIPRPYPSVQELNLISASVAPNHIFWVFFP